LLPTSPTPRLKRLLRLPQAQAWAVCINKAKCKNSSDFSEEFFCLFCESLRLSTLFSTFSL
jgi:hypothetical protein